MFTGCHYVMTDCVVWAAAILKCHSVGHQCHSITLCTLIFTCVLHVHLRSRPIYSSTLIYIHPSKPYVHHVDQCTPYMHIHVHLCTPIYTYVHLLSPTYIYLCAPIYNYIHPLSPIYIMCTYVHLYTPMYTCIHLCAPM